jgi:DNA polymerase III alpha subunit
MAEVFKDFPDTLQQTMRIAERCNVTLEEGQNYLPNFEVPAGFTLDDYFEHVAREGFGRSRHQGRCVTQSTSTRRGSRTRST